MARVWEPCQPPCLVFFRLVDIDSHEVFASGAPIEADALLYAVKRGSGENAGPRNLRLAPRCSNHLTIQPCHRLAMRGCIFTAYMRIVGAYWPRRPLLQAISGVPKDGSRGVRRSRRRTVVPLRVA